MSPLLYSKPLKYQTGYLGGSESAKHTIVEQPTTPKPIHDKGKEKVTNALLSLLPYLLHMKNYESNTFDLQIKQIKKGKNKKKKKKR